MTRELMDDAQAVAEVCALGSQIEKGLIEAEKATRPETSKETETELRRWGPTPNGGHDPECRRAWALEVSRMPEISDSPHPLCPDRVFPNDGFSEK